MSKQKPFDKNMDKKLLRNGFEYYDDWEYGPESGWETSEGHNTIMLYRHDFGYLIQLHRSVGGRTFDLMIGSSNKARDIIRIKNALNKLE